MLTGCVYGSRKAIRVWIKFSKKKKLRKTWGSFFGIPFFFILPNNIASVPTKFTDLLVSIQCREREKRERVSFFILFRYTYRCT